MKGLIFAGCSFTWGQGLYYYSGLETLKEPAPHCYDRNLVTDAQKRYMETLRYPRLVANHFNTFEVVSKENGGSETSIIRFLNQAFGITDLYKNFIDENFSYNEIEYIIIQTSQSSRNDYSYINKYGENLIFNIFQPETKLKFYDWLFDEKKWSFDDWFRDHVKFWITEIKKSMEFFESKGIKTRILCWEADYLNSIQEDPWLNERFITLNYKNKDYYCIRYLMDENNYLTISNDYDNFENTPKDLHPSKECHSIISNSVIRKIENDFKYHIEKKNFIVVETLEKKEEETLEKEEDKFNLVYDSWDDKNNKPLQPNCKILYDEFFFKDTIDAVLLDFNIGEEYINRYKLSDIEKYPNKKFFYFITLIPDVMKNRILSGKTPILPEVIECWKLYKNFNVIIIEQQESESRQTFLELNNWTKNLNLNQTQLWLCNNNPRLNEYKIELDSNINIHSTRHLINYATSCMLSSIGLIEFKPYKNGYFFLCHNKKPRPNRYGILVLLKRYNILDDVDWSLVDGKIFDKENYLPFYYNVFNDIDINEFKLEIEYFNNISQKRSIFEEDKKWFNDYLTPWNYIYEKDTYENAYVNIVTETNFEVETIHITEKSFKPFLALQFPLILATKDHIKEIKKTYNLDFFDDIINHDYDDVEDPRERLFRFFDEVKRIHDNKDFFINFYINNKDRFIENQNKIIRISNENYDKNFLLSLIKNENI